MLALYCATYCSSCQIICLPVFSCDVVMSATVSVQKKPIRLDFHFLCKGFMVYLFIYVY